MKKDIEWLKEEIEEDIKSWGGGNPDYFRGASDAYENVKDWLNQLDEPEVLSLEWIDEHKVYCLYGVPVEKLQNLLVPKQEEVDRAYKEGYEKGKEHATRDDEPETVASVMADYFGAVARLKEVLAMEVEEMEENDDD